MHNHMGSESNHPITSPKGAAVVTLLLAALGVFTPFFASLALALVFAVIAVVVIAWIYWTDYMSVFEGRASGVKVLLPSLSGIAVIVMAGLAILGAPKPSVQKPSLTVEDIERVISKAAPKDVQPQPERPVIVPRERVTIIEVPSAPRAVQPELPIRRQPNTKPNNESLLDELEKRTARRSAGFDQYYSCLGRYQAIPSKIFDLMFQTTIIQNTYADGRKEKKMVVGLEEWSKKVDAFFKETPEVSEFGKVFYLADDGQGARTFLGIGQKGYRAWASMDAKRKALEALAADLSKDKTCEANRAKAVQQCLDSGAC